MRNVSLYFQSQQKEEYLPSNGEGQEMQNIILVLHEVCEWGKTVLKKMLTIHYYTLYI